MNSQRINCLLRKVNFSKMGPFFFLFSFYSKIKLDKIKKYIYIMLTNTLKEVVNKNRMMKSTADSEEMNAYLWYDTKPICSLPNFMQPQKRR